MHSNSLYNSYTLELSLIWKRNVTASGSRLALFPSNVPFLKQKLRMNIGNRAKPRSLPQQSALFSELRAIRPLRNQSQHVFMS